MSQRPNPLRRLAAVAILSAAVSLPVRAQSRADVIRERSAFAGWLTTSSVSPLRALVVRPISTGLTLGPASADIPLAGMPERRLTEREGAAQLKGGGNEIGLARGRLQTVDGWHLIVSGPPGRGAVTVFAGRARPHAPPVYFPYDTGMIRTVTLRPPAAPGLQRILAPDGVEVEAGDAGTVDVPDGSGVTTLRVRRLPGATEDESELEIYFRDATSGHGSYPAGRFVSLIPRTGGGYLLDFNRARNPYCAYNTVYPCPAPWSGNALKAAVKAGERYTGKTLEIPSP